MSSFINLGVQVVWHTGVGYKDGQSSLGGTEELDDSKLPAHLRPNAYTPNPFTRNTTFPIR
jgi:hypothetical protein